MPELRDMPSDERPAVNEFWSQIVTILSQPIPDGAFVLDSDLRADAYRAWQGYNADCAAVIAILNGSPDA